MSKLEEKVKCFILEKEMRIIQKRDLSYFRRKFEEWCTLIFITRKGQKYMWGFKLSEKKSIEIKQIIQNMREETE